MVAVCVGNEQALKGGKEMAGAQALSRRLRALRITLEPSSALNQVNDQNNEWAKPPDGRSLFSWEFVGELDSAISVVGSDK